MNKIIAIAAPVLLLLGSSCSAITDFDEGLLSKGNLYSLQENIGSSVGVTIDGATSSATIELLLVEPLPDAEASELSPLLTGGTIELIVQNNATGVNYHLTDGDLVEAPARVGEYTVIVSGDRTIVSVEFYNEFNGDTLLVGGDYIGMIQVLDNDYFFRETFTVDVAVSSN